MVCEMNEKEEPNHCYFEFIEFILYSIGRLNMALYSIGFCMS